jgi:glyoxylase-like metal-dependent hydrolase (beta-lactamase superfamily II)/8-oxo-dGTP pyrophosphatase MutT (NUDIX family)
MSPSEAPRLVPRPAATLILLRDSPAGPEVLMLQRTKSAVFLGGAYVFPGGSLDAEDAKLSNRVIGLEVDPNALQPPIEYWIAAVRECFEEAGVLIACDVERRPIPAARAERLMAWRDRPFAELLEREDLYIPAGELAYFGHWITAPGRARRFDTRFFVAAAPQGQQGQHDANETVHELWITPREALERAARNEIELVFATQHTLRELCRFARVEDALAHVRGLDEIEVNRACWAQGKDGPKLFRRADPQYHEIHWSDPEETGQTRYEIVAGEPKRLDRYVTRLTAPNPGMMTGPGTNTYIVGDGERAVIDPGPDIASHIEKILAFQPIKWILCTHTHMDHSPAAAAIKAATGAQVLGRPAPAGQDATFTPDLVLEDGQRIQIGDREKGVRLRVLHTPGHASNHLCFLLEETNMLFTGDHVMQGSTVVINPPDGDMRAYLASLERLLAEEIGIIAPGHGYLVGAPHKELRRLLAHRRAREQKVVRALARLGAASLDELLPLVYDDVPARVHRVAARSLTAHLDKLVIEGTIRTAGAKFTLVESRAAG